MAKNHRCESALGVNRWHASAYKYSSTPISSPVLSSYHHTAFSRFEYLSGNTRFAMFRLLSFAPALVALAAAQDITNSASPDPIPTPDALPLADLQTVSVPTYTEIPGLSSQAVPYATRTAIVSASVEQSETPLSVFPAVTDVPINAAGEDDLVFVSPSPSASADSVEKRDLLKRTACEPQATIPNYYGVNVDTHSAFQSDAAIASAASSAPVPAGYSQNFANLQGASSAYAYMGYSVITTGYDTAKCASKCDAIDGCLAFNIYFERDPTVEPSTGCEDPPAFANIKCSFWGGAVDSNTATNTGQWRSSFQVGIAGSNGYTSLKIGAPIAGWDVPQKLDNAAMNAPLRDCAGTWTYLGYKIFQSGPYDPRLCSAACDAQTAYNVAHPPSSGKAPKCAAFGTYALSVTNKTGTYQQGQMCTMYTSFWDKQYAINTVAYDDSIGAKYTYSYSFFYSKPDIQPICSSDISYLASSGADFCTSYIGYTAPSVTAAGTPTTEVVTVTVTTAATTTATTSVDSTVTKSIVWKRDESNVTEEISVATVDSVPPYSFVILTTFAAPFTWLNGSVPTDAPPNVVAPTDAPSSVIAKRTAAGGPIATPSSIALWPASRISEACSDVATGTITITALITEPVKTTTTTIETVVPTTTLYRCAVPSRQPGYQNFMPLVGSWSDDHPGYNSDLQFDQSSIMQLPFQVGFSGHRDNKVTVNTDGFLRIGGVTFEAFTNPGNPLYLYHDDGIYVR